MAELPNKRPRRSENDMDRRRRSPDIRSSKDTRDRGAREERGGRDSYGRDGHRERDRRYRSRSRDRERDRDKDRDRHEGLGRERGGRRDETRERERERDREGGRGGRRDDGRGRDYRDSRGSWRGEGDKDRERERDRKRPREEDSEKRATRSRSPARDVAAVLDAGRSPVPAKGVGNGEVIGSRSRTATPPVAFKVGAGARGHLGAGNQNGQAYKEHGESNEAQSHAPAVHDPDAMNTNLSDTDDAADKKPKGKTAKKSKVEAKNVEDDDDIVVEGDDAMAAMQAMLGFGGFGTTKQKKVAGNDVYAVRKEKKTEYRQYMNRVGGFNRPLSPSRD